MTVQDFPWRRFIATACFFNVKKRSTVAQAVCQKKMLRIFALFHDNADFDAASYKSGRFMLSSHTGKDSAARLDVTTVCSLRTLLYREKIAKNFIICESSGCDVSVNMSFWLHVKLWLVNYSESVGDGKPRIIPCYFLPLRSMSFNYRWS